jgi:hypothetical protein
MRHQDVPTRSENDVRLARSSRQRIRTSPRKAGQPPTGCLLRTSSTPLFALLICFLFGAIGLTAARFQRRSVRR